MRPCEAEKKNGGRTMLKCFGRNRGKSTRVRAGAQPIDNATADATTPRTPPRRPAPGRLERKYRQAETRGSDRSNCARAYASCAPRPVREKERRKVGREEENYAPFCSRATGRLGSVRGWGARTRGRSVGERDDSCTTNKRDGKGPVDEERLNLRTTHREFSVPQRRDAPLAFASRSRRPHGQILRPETPLRAAALNIRFVSTASPSSGVSSPAWGGAAARPRAASPSPPRPTACSGSAPPR